MEILYAYDHHIAHQNAVNILSSVMGVKVSQMKEKLDKETREEVNVRRQKIRTDNFKPTDLKRLINNPEEQIEEMRKLIAPKHPEIKGEDLGSAGQEGMF